MIDLYELSFLEIRCRVVQVLSLGLKNFELAKNTDYSLFHEAFFKTFLSYRIHHNKYVIFDEFLNFLPKKSIVFKFYLN